MFWGNLYYQHLLPVLEPAQTNSNGYCVSKIQFQTRGLKISDVRKNKHLKCYTFMLNFCYIKLISF